MDKETFMSNKPFAGDKKPSMLRRCVTHDYQERQMYLITMVTDERRPLFGQVTGRSDAPYGSPDYPHTELSPMGTAVRDCWQAIPSFHPEIRLIALQIMPDHFHGILFVSERMECSLGDVLLGFKTGCNKRFREVLPVQYVAAMRRQTERNNQASAQRDRKHGLLFAPGYNDRLLLRKGQLDRWKAYLSDNPRRLLIKRENPDFFSVQRNLKVSGMTFSAIGNRFLLERPVKLPVQCSRSITMEDLEKKKRELLAAAAQGAVLVSPAISAGEKDIMRAAFDAGYPEIILLENGFTDLAKPGGARFDACSRGQLLLLAPWDHHNEHITIRREQCQILNTMTHQICE